MARGINNLQQQLNAITAQLQHLVASTQEASTRVNVPYSYTSAPFAQPISFVHPQSPPSHQHTFPTANLFNQAPPHSNNMHHLLNNYMANPTKDAELVADTAMEMTIDNADRAAMDSKGVEAHISPPNILPGRTSKTCKYREILMHTVSL